MAPRPAPVRIGQAAIVPERSEFARLEAFEDALTVAADVVQDGERVCRVYRRRSRGEQNRKSFRCFAEIVDIRALTIVPGFFLGPRVRFERIAAGPPRRYPQPRRRSARECRRAAGIPPQSSTASWSKAAIASSSEAPNSRAIAQNAEEVGRIRYARLFAILQTMGRKRVGDRLIETIAELRQRQVRLSWTVLRTVRAQRERGGTAARR